MSISHEFRCFYCKTATLCFKRVLLWEMNDVRAISIMVQHPQLSKCMKAVLGWIAKIREKNPSLSGHIPKEEDEVWAIQLRREEVLHSALHLP